MIRGGILRSDQDKKQMRRPAIQGIEFDASAAARKDAKDPLQAGQFTMRDCHPFANGRGTDPFALPQYLEHFVFIKTLIIGGESFGQLLKHGVFFLTREARNDRFDAQKIADFHALILLRLTLYLSFCLRT